MAENERLDVLKNRRWFHLMRFIASRPRDADIPRRLVEAMYRTLRNAGKQIPLAEFLKAASGQLSFGDSVARCHHDFAEMIERVAADTSGDTTATTAERFVEAILDRYLDQIGLKVVGDNAFPTFDSFCLQANEWKLQIKPALQRLASNLEAGRAPRVPAQPVAVRAAEREELMALSLLTGSVQRNHHGAGS
jgi:hypothetical protein